MRHRLQEQDAKFAYERAISLGAWGYAHTAGPGELNIPAFAGDVTTLDVLPTPAMGNALAAVAAKGSAGSLAYAVSGTVHCLPDLADRPDDKNPRDFPFQHRDYLSPVPGIAHTFR